MKRFDWFFYPHGLIGFLWLNLVFWFNHGFITLEGVVLPALISHGAHQRIFFSHARVLVSSRLGELTLVGESESTYESMMKSRKSSSVA